jgi:hypothetical protein
MEYSREQATAVLQKTIPATLQKDWGLLQWNEGQQGWELQAVGQGEEFPDLSVFTLVATTSPDWVGFAIGVTWKGESLPRFIISVNMRESAKTDHRIFDTVFQGLLRYLVLISVMPAEERDAKWENLLETCILPGEHVSCVKHVAM